MRQRNSAWVRRVALAALFLAGLPCAGARAADEDAAKAQAAAARARYARELLIRRAVDGVRADRVEEEGVAANRAAFLAQRPLLSRIDPVNSYEAVALIGNEAPGGGLIGAGVRLLQWMSRLEVDRDAGPFVVYRGETFGPDLPAMVAVDCEVPGEEQIAHEKARR
ncbi:MAG: hypothetical protein O2894_03220, partial [Planctomycetota bacterium]|nr:hypothetical protein [Planctomycetota bacterium]